MTAALVTGGSGGIGAAACRALAEGGWHVLVGYASNRDAAEAVATACGGEAVHCDVTGALEVPDDVRALVHAAGVTGDDLLLRLDDATLARTLDVNLAGGFRACRAALRPMVRARHGRIVLVTSVVALRGNAGQTAYAAAKAGLVGLTRSLAREVARKGVTVNAVAPGFVETAMTADLGADVRAGFVDGTPLGRPVTAEEVAVAIRFLCSEEASAITGAVLQVDGGATA